jgi:REP element-mobilizing transposase RayT
MIDKDSLWDDNEKPLAYFITFRTYGTWLHGDERTSIDIHDGWNVYGSPKRPNNAKLELRMKESMDQSNVLLDPVQREIVTQAIKDVCKFRGYVLHAMNVRTNHAHIVVTACKPPETVADEFKKYSTRSLRENGLVTDTAKIWSRGRSRQYLWKPYQLDGAIDYVLYGQGPIPEELGGTDDG